MQQGRPNCAIAKKLYEAFLAGDLQAIFTLLAPNVEWELVGSKEVPHFGIYHGIDQVKKFFSIIAEINRVESQRQSAALMSSVGSEVTSRGTRCHSTFDPVRSWTSRTGVLSGSGSTRTRQKWSMLGAPDRQCASEAVHHLAPVESPPVC